jgi:hypothetical protein
MASPSLLSLTISDNTTRPNTVITVTVQPNFPGGPPGAGSSIFWGVDPDNGGRGKGAAVSFVDPNQILIQGAFESGFIDAAVDASNGVKGHITVAPPIPVPINIQLLGGSSLYTLPANTAAGDFELHLAGQPEEPAGDVRARAARMST